MDHSTDHSTGMRPDDTGENAFEEDCGCLLVQAPGLRAGLQAAGVFTRPADPRPLALLDEHGELLALVSLISLGAGRSVP